MTEGIIASRVYPVWLGSRIDARFDYFGGAENGVLFVASGVFPAAIGSLLYGRFLYGRSPVRVQV